MQNIWLVIFSGTVVPALVSLYLITVGMNECHRAVEKQEGRWMLSYSRGYRHYAVTLTLVTLLVALLIPTRMPELSGVEKLVLAVFFGGVMLFDYYLFKDAIYTRFSVDSTGVQKSGLRGQQYIRWIDIDQVKFSRIWQAFELSGSSGDELKEKRVLLRVSQYTSGLATLLAEMKQPVDQNQLDKLELVFQQLDDKAG